MASPPWIASPSVETLGILLPPFLSVLAVLAWPDSRVTGHPVSPWLWLSVILAVDVAHVYASLYRTYFDAEEFYRRQSLYIAVPLAAWLAGVLLYSVRPTFFWTALAYLAVFHFVRQQYGFVRIYSRLESTASRRIDAVVIYAATLYPLLHWHASLPRDFFWFIDGDFLHLPHWLEPPGRWAYFAVLALYLGKEGVSLAHGVAFNWPRNAVVLGTAASWYVGIVAFDADVAFTLTNVLTHGVPYFCLVWMTCRARHPGRAIFSVRALPLFLGLLVGLAYFEELLWDGLVWGDHSTLFPAFLGLAPVTSKSALAWVIPLLATPQAAHYLLDGFIWRRTAFNSASSAAGISSTSPAQWRPSA